MCLRRVLSNTAESRSEIILTKLKSGSLTLKPESESLEAPRFSKIFELITVSLLFISAGHVNVDQALKH